ncbi:MAG: response regulator [Candidatus Nitrosocosmicus sp.]|jgi:CheY-like chemotaxis protein|nr:response regulator [Candidatus Nitrosocosmicus sp.]
MGTEKPANSRKKVVMVCEDEEELLEVYTKVLEMKYTVIRVASGIECIKKYLELKSKGSPIDLLFLDYNLGDMYGDSVAKKIKVLNGIKIILISAYNLDESLKEDLVKKQYIEKFIQKPIKMRQIIDEAVLAIC